MMWIVFEDGYSCKRKVTMKANALMELKKEHGQVIYIGKEAQ